MRRSLTGLLLFFMLQAVAQNAVKREWRPVQLYANHDTISCKMLFNGAIPYAWDRFEVLTGSDTSFLFAKDVPMGITIISGDSNWHYGVIAKEFIRGQSQKIFVPRICSGAIELYEHRYVSWSTHRQTGTNHYYPYVNYFLAKPVSGKAVALVLLKRFTKKAIAPWLSDQKELLYQAPNKFDLSGLINLLMQYNAIVSKKKNDN
jgi:hypothetical protein